jgi:hypothetical protein
MTTVAMSYDDLAARLGISVPSARRLVQRRRWSKSLGNGGKAVVQVPEDFLSQRDATDDGQDDTTTATPTDVAADVETTTPTVAPPDITTDLVARLTAVQAEMAEMARRLGTAEGELRAVREERDHLRQMLDRYGHLIEQQTRPWWRRVVGL